MTVDKVWVRVCTLTDLPEGRAVNLHVNGQRLVVAREGESAYVVQGYCTHMLYALKDAAVKDCTITCPLHGSQFDLRTGAVLHWPLPDLAEAKARKMLRTFETEVRDGEVYLSWAASSPDKVRVRL
jgi:3-phenylpropionate/trans-cinnamate dioxygenase ferredoxin subunit